MTAVPVDVGGPLGDQFAPTNQLVLVVLCHVYVVAAQAADVLKRQKSADPKMARPNRQKRFELCDEQYIANVE